MDPFWSLTTKKTIVFDQTKIIMTRRRSLIMASNRNALKLEKKQQINYLLFLNQWGAELLNLIPKSFERIHQITEYLIRFVSNDSLHLMKLCGRLIGANALKWLRRRRWPGTPSSSWRFSGWRKRCLWPSPVCCRWCSSPCSALWTRVTCAWPTWRRPTWCSSAASSWRWPSNTATCTSASPSGCSCWSAPVLDGTPPKKPFFHHFGR